MTTKNSHAAKKIILCSDGTGNKGGYTPDSNVYKIYNAIEIHDPNIKQYTYYDNGVGTSTNKYWRALSGAIGLGIKQNIIDLYMFLALNYHPGDEVYLFGFSRGAATIRAFCGFIATSGLINGNDLNEDELKIAAEKAFQEYILNARKLDQKPICDSPNSSNYGAIEIKFVGVWDTVSALGFPKRTEKKSLSLFILNNIFKALEAISDCVWPHAFYQYQLTTNIKNAYHALAIDDERTAFWPKIWNEKGSDIRNTHIEQVWFSGMHSNVGGGYERQGMANITLQWMMLRAQQQGLHFKENKLEQIKEDSNIHGRLYNSRDGLAIYYRYHPRNISQLCHKKLRDNIKIHCSVLERMKKRTANYAPIALPNKFTVVQSELHHDSLSIDSSNNSDWKMQNKIIVKTINIRKFIYGIFTDASFIVGAYSAHLFLKETPVEHQAESLLNKSSSSTLTDLLSMAFDESPKELIIFTLFCLILFKVRNHYYHKMTHAAEKIRKVLVASTVKKTS